MPIILFLIILSALSACSGQLVMLQHADTGDVKTCQASMSDTVTTGAWLAHRDIKKCVSALKNIGYTVID
jgi:hypothetical protein